MAKIISSQCYLDDDIVKEKSENEDYDVQYIMVDIEGEEYEIVVDGHHSLAAAIQDGVEPNWEHDRAGQRNFDRLGLKRWLEQHDQDCDWYEVFTKEPVW